MTPSLRLKFIRFYFRKVELEVTANMTGAELDFKYENESLLVVEVAFVVNANILFSVFLFKVNPTKMVLKTLLISRLNGIALNWNFANSIMIPRSSRYPSNLSPSVPPVLYLFCTQISVAFRYGSIKTSHKFTQSLLKQNQRILHRIGLQHDSPSRTRSWWRIKCHTCSLIWPLHSLIKTKQSACAKQEHSNDKLTHCGFYGFKDQISISFTFFVGSVFESRFLAENTYIFSRHDFCYL